MHSWIRASILVAALGCAVAACGDGKDVEIRFRGEVPAGFFIGRTAEGEDISLAIDSLRSVFLVCGGDEIVRRFDPPVSFSESGRFTVRVGPADGIIVRGRVVNDDRIDGTISGDPDCDGDFVVRRCDPDRQDCDDDDEDTIPNEVDPDERGATPTPRPSGTPTATRTTAPAVPTPTATASPASLCGNGEIDEDEQCDGTDLDDSTCFDLCDQDDEGGTLRCTANCTFDFSGCPPPRDCEAP